MYAFIFTILIVLITTLAFPSSMTARTPETSVLRWSPISTPGSYSDRNDILTPGEINGIAAASDGNTIYALDIPNAMGLPAPIPGIWKSVDTGISWSPRPTVHLCAAVPAPTLPVMDIAVAPDNPDLVAAVCLNSLGTLRGEVYFSDDGGATWLYSGPVPWIHGAGEQIGDVAVSSGYNANNVLVHDVIIGSRHPANGVADGEIYVWRYPGFSGWKAQGFSLGDVIVVRPSPNYAEDFSLVVMAATTQRTYMSLGFRDVAADTCFWNIDSGWPVEICQLSQSGGIASGEDRIITGDVSLPSNFLGTQENQRLIFASYDSNHTSMGPSQVLDDVYRLNNTTVTPLRLPGAASTARVSTLVYHGDGKSGKLMAGEVAADSIQASTRTWFCLDPLSLCPTWHVSIKPPTGGGKDGFANAQLAWPREGSTVYVGTGSGNRDTSSKWSDPTSPSWAGQSLDESAFSISSDDGNSWNQTGLIDTRIDWLKSVAVAEDESTIYVASANDIGFDSIWRSQSSLLGDNWQRVMCFTGDSSVLKLAPDAKDGANVFWADQGTDQTRSSLDHGQTWQDCLPNIIVQDIIAPDSRNIYVLQADGQVRHGSYASAWTWAKPADTDLSSSHTILAYADFILVGSAVNESSPAAYSADNGRTWLKITAKTPSSGNRHVAFDPDFDSNQIIYVADDADGIYRWGLGRSDSWEDMAPPDHGFYSIHPSPKGPLYGAFSATGSGVDRALYPRSGIPKPGVNWDSIAIGLPPNAKLSSEPDSMAISENTLCAIDDRAYGPSAGTGLLWAFIDTLSGRGPRLIEPADGAALGCDPVSGRNQDISLSWEQLSLADAYEVEIAKDQDFNLRVTEAEPSTNPYYTPPAVTNPAYRILPAGLPEANATYYWRIRVRQAATGQVIRSYWSDTSSFIIKAGLRVVSPYLGAQALQPVHGACNLPVSFIAFSWTPFKGTTEYRFVLARDSALTDIVVQDYLPTTAYKYNGRLDYDTSYFWQVTPTKPLPGEPSPVFCFITVVEPTPSQVPSPLYDQLLQWLQVSVLINVLGFVSVLGMIIVFSRRIR
jgi:hypothetical protein